MTVLLYSRFDHGITSFSHVRIPETSVISVQKNVTKRRTTNYLQTFTVKCNSSITPNSAPLSYYIYSSSYYNLVSEIKPISDQPCKIVSCCLYVYIYIYYVIYIMLYTLFVLLQWWDYHRPCPFLFWSCNFEAFVLKSWVKLSTLLRPTGTMQTLDWCRSLVDNAVTNCLFFHSLVQHAFLVPQWMSLLPLSQCLLWTKQPLSNFISFYLMALSQPGTSP